MACSHDGLDIVVQHVTVSASSPPPAAPLQHHFCPLLKTAFWAMGNLLLQLSETFAGRKILLGVDRLDYIKGVPHKVKKDKYVKLLL